LQFSDGNVAYDTVKKRENQILMLLDLMMPGSLNGFPSLGKRSNLTKAPKAIPVVVFF
jgi:hypothetical protein